MSERKFEDVNEEIAYQLRRIADALEAINEYK